jgi:hypothetical protein
MSGNGFLKTFYLKVEDSKPFLTTFAGVAQLVEHQLPKLRVEGSSPFARSKIKTRGCLGLLRIFKTRSFWGNRMPVSG